MIVFDLDGTLVDTRDAVYAAYAFVGVRPPRGSWGRPWYEWLDEQKHQQKNEVYPRFLRTLGKPLPLLVHALRTRAPVITGASLEAVAAVRKAFNAQALNVVRVQATIWQKADYLRLDFDEPGTYVDDDADARREINRRTEWDAITPKACLRSFSQRARTNG